MTRDAENDGSPREESSPDEHVSGGRQARRSRAGRLRGTSITLAHGGGGKAMRDLIDDVFVSAFENPLLAPL
ncbi:MAG TPA: hypothetical protein PLV92_22785, partial [Pirellulaceae bacterium]|nr:hypothetical protein [Pirellulaceae bacterium]